MTLGFPPFSVFHFSQRFAFDCSERLCWQFEVRNPHPVHEVRLRAIPFWRCTLLPAYAYTQNNKCSLVSCRAPWKTSFHFCWSHASFQISDNCFRTHVKKRLPSQVKFLSEVLRPINFTLLTKRPRPLSASHSDEALWTSAWEVRSAADSVWSEGFERRCLETCLFFVSRKTWGNSTHRCFYYDNLEAVLCQFLISA